MKAPFPYFGGKSRAAHLIWERFGNVPNYVEPFAGSLAVLLDRPHKPKTETVNDKDAYIANFWRALQHAPDEVAKWADYPINEVDLHARHLWLMQNPPDVERLMTDPDYFDAKQAGWWVWGKCLWIGSGWCSKDELRTNGTPRRKLPQLHNSQGVISTTRQIPSLSSVHGMGVLAHSMHGGLTDRLDQLAKRLSKVRIACGEWDRILGDSTTITHGITAVLLDPPYGDFEHWYSESNATARAACEWAIANGNNPMLRIALCGYEGEHQVPDSWECVAWKANGGYSNVNPDNQNAKRERVWFSPHCLKVDAPKAVRLFELEAQT